MNPLEFQKQADLFINHITVEKNLSEHTQRSYHNDLKQLCEFWQRINTTENSTLPLRTALERFFVMLYHKKINKSSIARKISCLKSFEKYLNAQGIELNLKLSRPRLDKTLPTYLSIDEIFYLLDTIKNDDLPTKRPYRDKAIFELLYATGIRCSELVSIKLNDINLEEKTIRITGKGKRERIVLFGQKAHEKLVNYLIKERPLTEPNTENLFLNYRNEPLTSRSIQRIFEMFKKFLKIQRPITPHKIRHSFATHLLSQGADLRLVQELLGHKTLSSTEKYTHITPSQLTQMCDKLHPFNSFIKKKNNKI